MFYLCRTTPHTFAEHPITCMRPTHIGQHALKTESNNSSVTPETYRTPTYYPCIPFSIPSYPSPGTGVSFFSSASKWVDALDFLFQDCRLLIKAEGFHALDLLIYAWISSQHLCFSASVRSYGFSCVSCWCTWVVTYRLPAVTVAIWSRVMTLLGLMCCE